MKASPLYPGDAWRHAPEVSPVSPPTGDGDRETGVSGQAGLWAPALSVPDTLGRGRCASCGAHQHVLVGMQAGRDGRPWGLCWACWSNGVAEPGPTASVAEKHAGVPQERAEQLGLTDGGPR